ncbi:MAG: hypothetical protein KY468_14250 [Armatimonadetes bacterium]|nr:hypothetical protein [Armatimonadota bacterium]
MFSLIFSAASLPATAAWQSAADMSAGRYAPTATLLPDGKILVAGGFDGTTTVASAQLFDPGSLDPATGRPGTFSPTGSLLTGRNFATATLLDNGTVLIAGGYNEAPIGSLGSLDTAEIYTPSTGKFTRLSARMTSPRELFTATKLPNGKVLLAGGFNTRTGRTLATAELYDPATGRFTATGTMKAAYGRFGHDALLLPTPVDASGNPTKVMIAGGKERSGPQAWFPLRSVELYDIPTGTFTTLGQMLNARDRPTAAWIAALKKVLVIGGQGTDANGKSIGVLPTEFIDPVARTFSPGPPLHKGRMAHTLSPLPDGSVLVAGGWSDSLDATPGSTTDTAERFIPTSQSGAFVWADPNPQDATQPAGMKASRHDQGAVALQDGRVIIFGGKQVETGGAITYLAGTEVYTAPRRLGDVNGDGSVDVSDGVLVVQATVKIVTLTPEQAQVADVNKDKLMNVADAVKILRVAVKLDPPFPE